MSAGEDDKGGFTGPLVPPSSLGKPLGQLAMRNKIHAGIAAGRASGPKGLAGDLDPEHLIGTMVLFCIDENPVVVRRPLLVVSTTDNLISGMLWLDWDKDDISKFVRTECTYKPTKEAPGGSAPGYTRWISGAKRGAGYGEWLPGEEVILRANTPVTRVPGPRNVPAPRMVVGKNPIEAVIDGTADGLEG